MVAARRPVDDVDAIGKSMRSMDAQSQPAHADEHRHHPAART